MSDFQDALSKFNRDKPAWYGWKKVDASGNRIPNDQRMTYENIELLDPTATIPSKAEIDAKLKEMEWLENRRKEYPTIEELVVACYDTDDKAAIEKRRADVKAKYPKPE